jgi:AcrR family transcriptional regulator
MARDSEGTRRRIFQAATAEFATHGIAGARIDRIAAAAGANKQLIYAYFGNKRRLFEAVVTEHVSRLLDDVPFDPADLPGHAAALFDFHVANPEITQLGGWHALEPGEAEHRIPLIERAIRARTREIAAAQRRGVVDSSLAAAELVTLIAAIAGAWASATPERDPRGRRVSSRTLAARRATVREAVRRLVDPRT